MWTTPVRGSSLVSAQKGLFGFVVKGGGMIKVLEHWQVVIELKLLYQSMTSDRGRYSLLRA